MIAVGCAGAALASGAIVNITPSKDKTPTPAPRP
jgi:hypothetical protein